MKTASIARKAANIFANTISFISRKAVEFNNAVAKALADEKASPITFEKDGFRRRSKATTQWDGGEGQATKYALTRRIHAGRSSSIRKIQTLNRLRASEKAGA